MTTPIFALTANVMQSDRERCESAGCTGFLTKPIDIDQLLAEIANVLPIDESASVEVPPKSTDDQLSLESIESPIADGESSESLAVSAVTEVTKSIDDVMALVDRALTPGMKRPKDQPKLYSTLPTEVPEFRDIVVDFARGLPEMLTQMRQALQRSDFAELRALAHKLKGTGGTVGFADFTDPAQRLQQHADDEENAGVESVLSELEALAFRVAVADEIPVG